jgi:hypothetical protein
LLKDRSFIEESLIILDCGHPAQTLGPVCGSKPDLFRDLVAACYLQPDRAAPLLATPQQKCSSGRSFISSAEHGQPPGTPAFSGPSPQFTEAERVTAPCDNYRAPKHPRRDFS